MAETVLVDSLWELQEQVDQSGRSYPQLADLRPSLDSIYELDLNTRTAKLPHFCSVQYDHNAEIIYFQAPRYYDNVDLTQMTCIIQYINANGDAGLYWVPYYDTNYYGDQENAGNFLKNPTILIPWVIDGLATIASGKITFSIRFYKLIKHENGEYEYTYNLSTRPQNMDIIVGMDLQNMDVNKYSRVATDTVEQIYGDMHEAIANAAINWIDL